LIQRNREFAHANSCGMPNGIRDLTRCTGDADLAHAFDAERVDVRIAFLDLLTLVETGSRFPSTILLVFLRWHTRPSRERSCFVRQATRLMMLLSAAELFKRAAILVVVALVPIWCGCCLI